MAPRFAPPPLKPATAEAEEGVVNFNFRTMDHLKAYVLVNGERVSDTPCLWGYSKSYAFDPRIPVTEWPPKGAAFVAAADGVELALEGGLYDLNGQARITKNFPSFEAGEMILYVNTTTVGALRLKLVGEDGCPYRYTNYTPLQSDEEETASRFRRAIWFQRERSE